MRPPVFESEPDVIRKSTDRDFYAIRQWLRAEKAAGVEDNFLCNWPLIKKCHDEGKLIVYVDGASGVAVAFQFGGLLAPGILEVRHDMRCRGIGRKLVEDLIEEARKNDEPFLRIECTPPSSIPFWKKMGFTLYRSKSDKNLAYRVLEWKHELPVEGRSVRAEIRFYPEDRNGDQRFAAGAVSAKCTSDETVFLSERVSFFKMLHSEERDTAVEIVVDGECRYLGKAKYAKEIGVKQRINGFYIDAIHPSRAANGTKRALTRNEDGTLDQTIVSFSLLDLENVVHRIRSQAVFLLGRESRTHL